jgi:DNA repair exonuclease SbcCD ATPase subunit
MKIKEISWKNFSSYGNNLQKIVFEEDQGNFYLVVGSNGAGKSTISDVIKFGLYGKVDNKKLGDIPNRFNGNAYVKVVLEKNASTTITIERGIAPGIFKVFVNGIEYQQAGKKNVQAFLEEEVLEIPYYVFNNMVSLSINDFKSFISMNAHDKRTIIDRLFGLEILGHIRWRIKAKMKEIKDEIELINTEISVLSRSIQNSTNELELLNEKLKIASDEKKSELEAAIQKLQTFIEAAETHIQKITTASAAVKSSLKTITDTKRKMEYEKFSRNEKIALFSAGKCPTCETDLTTSYHQELLQSYIQENTEVATQLTELSQQESGMLSKLSELELKYKEVSDKKTLASARISDTSTQLRKIGGKANDEQTMSLQNIITDSEESKQAAVRKSDLEEKKVNFYRLVEEVFGDKGIKLMAIKRILPILNSEIKKILIELNMDYRVTFNEEFEVSIQHLGYPVTPDQLSTGERKKVDFAVLVSLIRIMKTKFTGVNITFLDEIFSSIDSDGIHQILKVLCKTCRELRLNIFVINHSQLPTEIFDYRLEITKNNGFSNLYTEKLS